MEHCMEPTEYNNNNNNSNSNNNNSIVNNNINTNSEENSKSASDIMEFSPESTRILAVDDNVVCLTILTALLKKARYQVTSLSNKTEALTLLRQNVDNFDMVLTNVNMDEMDGFKLLEAGLEFDISVIMISATDSHSIVMKGVNHGAVDFMFKPVRFENVKTLWQHVYRKNCKGKRAELVISGDNTSLEKDKGRLKRCGKRKNSLGDDDDGGDDGGDEGEHSKDGVKRERVKWNKERHEKFFKAVEFLGGVEKAVPKKILELMGEPDLTREKVASHLQKYRKSIKKKQCLDESARNIINNNNNDNHYRHLLGQPHPSMGSMMGNRPFGHRPIPREFIMGSNYTHQPNNPSQMWMGPSMGYTPSLGPIGPIGSIVGSIGPIGPLTTQPLLLRDMPYNPSMPNNNDSAYASMGSNSCQPHPIHIDYPLDSKVQMPDELFDPSPMTDSTYEPPPSSHIFDMGSEYQEIFHFSEDDKKDHVGFIG